jgi:hypothetical protein
MAAPVEVRDAAELTAATAAGARQVVIPAFDGAPPAPRWDDSLAQALLPQVPSHVSALVRGPLPGIEALASLRGKADAVWLASPLLRTASPLDFLAPLVEAAENG